ncbi:HAD family hydrolase [Microbispora sp. RL4-1S]|uniref:HAD family hydrolase n=1 Tax=Microbispora oryzae TaxID=2806554 RepID=A0A940WKT9_9ACTN|nr:HAD family hydrolase [Microbispora oryzae]MBP2707509.1 HAD family hydrolase [Microbispora oryzae]
MRRLALFDLDNTLIDLDHAFGVWATEFIGAHGLGPEAFEWLIGLNREGNPHREEFFTQVREHLALTQTVDELVGGYRRRVPHLVRCRTEVLDGLARLRASGWRVAIVTNGTPENQLAKIQRTGLAEAVDAYAISGAEGIRKPEAGLFEIAAKRCGTSFDGGWMIGDNLTADIAGGRGVGLRTIWIDRRAERRADNQADHVVTDVLQAIEILRDGGSDSGATA